MKMAPKDLLACLDHLGRKETRATLEWEDRRESKGLLEKRSMCLPDQMTRKHQLI